MSHLWDWKSASLKRETNGRRLKIFNSFNKAAVADVLSRWVCCASTSGSFLNSFNKLQARSLTGISLSDKQGKDVYASKPHICWCSRAAQWPCHSNVEAVSLIHSNSVFCDIFHCLIPLMKQLMLYNKDYDQNFFFILTNKHVTVWARLIFNINTIINIYFALNHGRHVLGESH